MKKIIDKVLSPQWFAIGYLTWLAINMVAVINPLPFTRVLLAFFAVWGVAVSAKIYFFSGIKAWYDKYISILLAFLGVCLIVQLIQFQYGGLHRLIQFCYFALSIVVLYSQYGKSIEDNKKNIKILVRVLGIIIAITMLVSLIMFYNIYSKDIVGRSGVKFTIGLSENRLFGLFSSPNVGGTFALILIWCSLTSIRLNDNNKFRVMWIVISVLQILLAMTYISLSLSRGTYLSGMVLIIGYVLVRAPYLFEKKFKVPTQILIRLASMVLIIAVCLGSLRFLNMASGKILVWNNNLKDNVSDSENAQKVDEILSGFGGRVEAGRDDIDITNKRLAIWTTHLELLTGRNLFLGVNSPYDYYKANVENGVEFTEDQVAFIPYAAGNLHNGYIQVLVNCGLFAFLLLMAFLFICFFKVIKFVKYNISKGSMSLDNPSYLMFAITFPLVLAILSNNVVETNFVLMGANFFQALFWFVAGVCVKSMNEGELK